MNLLGSVPKVGKGYCSVANDGRHFLKNINPAIKEKFSNEAHINQINLECLLYNLDNGFNKRIEKNFTDFINSREFHRPQHHDSIKVEAIFERALYEKGENNS